MTFSAINFETLKACHLAFLQPKRHFSTAGDDVHTYIQIVVRSLTEICTTPHYRVESDEKAIVELSQKCFFVARSLAHIVCAWNHSTIVLYIAFNSTRKIYRERDRKVFLSLFFDTPFIRSQLQVSLDILEFQFNGCDMHTSETGRNILAYF